MDKAIKLDRHHQHLARYSYLLVIRRLHVDHYYDVTLRYFFSAPTEWAFDYAIMLYGTLLYAVWRLYPGPEQPCAQRHALPALSVRQQATLRLVLWFVFFFPGIIALMVAATTLPKCPGALRSARRARPGGPPIYHFKTVIPIAGFFIGLQGIAEVCGALLPSAPAAGQSVSPMSRSNPDHDLRTRGRHYHAVRDDSVDFYWLSDRLYPDGPRRPFWLSVSGLDVSSICWCSAPMPRCPTTCCRPCRCLCSWAM